MLKQKTALITGANSGIGLSITKKLAKDNFLVYALDLNPEIINAYKDNPNVIPLVCDITQDIDVSKVADSIKHLDIIINCAGIVCIGSLIENEPDYLNKILQVNLVGTYRINKMMFTKLDNQGKIIIFSSEYGKIDALPFHGFYTMTKHAVDVYINSLRRELLNTNIKVIGIRPGAFKTSMQDSIQHLFNFQLEKTTHYHKPLTKMEKLMQKELLKAADVNILATKIVKIINKNHPRRFYNIHNSFKMKLYSILPSNLQDMFINIFFK